MRNKRENLSARILDALSGYTVVVLSIICFIIALAVVIAIVRLLGGA